MKPNIRLIPATLVLVCLTIWSAAISALFQGCGTTANQTVYQSISATEAGVIAANGAYLDSVVSGLVSTNGVPKVEAAFNDTQLALHTAAVLASGGASAPVPASVFAKAVNFTNTINANK